MKKMICAFMAIVMCMAMAVPALASSGGTSYSGGLVAPTIEVVVPASTKIFLNPYQIAISRTDIASGDAMLSGESITSGDVTLTSLVITPTAVLKNKSDVPVNVSLTATGTIPTTSNATFATAPLATTEKNKKVFLYLEWDNKGNLADANAPKATEVFTWSTDTPDSTKYDATKVFSTTNTNGTQAVIKSGALVLKDIVKMPPKKVVSASETQYSYLTMNIGGGCTTTPTEKWAATDVVDVALAYTFQATNNSVSS
jgi:hypothetical protein